MEKDSEIEAISKENELKEKRIQTMKEKIQKMQMKMSQKGSNASANTKANQNHKNVPERQPVTIYNHYEKEYSSTSPVNTDKEFAFNSTLFKNINNESQPIIQNGSAVSNFSSVSNINNLLNGRFQDRKQPQESHYQERPKASSNLLSDIDQLLERSKNAKKMPIKAFEKFLDIKEVKDSKVFSEIEEVQSSRYSEVKKQDAGRLKLQEYRKIIEKLDTIPESQPPSKARAHQQRYQRSQPSDLSEPLRQKFGHKKSELSNFTNKSQFTQSQIRYPPLPSRNNPVERHKALIKESYQQLKKLSTEVSNQNLDQTVEIDLQLSDDQKQQDEKHHHRQQLLRQRQSLLSELQKIQAQLQVIQDSL